MTGEALEDTSEDGARESMQRSAGPAVGQKTRPIGIRIFDRAGRVSWKRPINVENK